MGGGNFVAESAHGLPSLCKRVICSCQKQETGRPPWIPIRDMSTNLQWLVMLQI
jgi:hypothetical protein